MSHKLYIYAHTHTHACILYAPNDDAVCWLVTITIVFTVPWQEKVARCQVKGCKSPLQQMWIIFTDPSNPLIGQVSILKGICISLPVMRHPRLEVWLFSWSWCINQSFIMLRQGISVTEASSRGKACKPSPLKWFKTLYLWYWHVPCHQGGALKLRPCEVYLKLWW